MRSFGMLRVQLGSFCVGYVRLVSRRTWLATTTYFFYVEGSLAVLPGCSERNVALKIPCLNGLHTLSSLAEPWCTHGLLCMTKITTSICRLTHTLIYIYI
jgi:hypothetical protein